MGGQASDHIKALRHSHSYINEKLKDCCARRPKVPQSSACNTENPRTGLRTKLKYALLRDTLLTNTVLLSVPLGGVPLYTHGIQRHACHTTSIRNMT